MYRKCVVCFQRTLRTEMHRFTENSSKRDEWISALCTTPQEKKELRDRINASNPPLLCESHFKQSDYFFPSPNTKVLKSTAVPFYKEQTTVSLTTVSSTTVSPSILPSLSVFSPPLTPGVFFPSTSSTSTTPVRRPRLPNRSVMNQEMDEDYILPPPTTQNEPDSEYLLVSKESLMDLLRQCTVCRKGKNNLSFRMDGLGFTCTRECNLCGMRSPWENSKPLRTANPSGKERLPKINVDIVSGSVLTAIGGTKLRQVMLMSGIHSLSTTTFHKIKKIYVSPAIDKEFFKMQGGVIDALRTRIEQGGKVHLSGDGSYDTRGYSADWCRYFFLDAETSEVLHHVIVHKSETKNSSSKMEVAALEKGLRELSLMIGGVEGIASLVTDRHAAAIKMVKEKFQGIDHFFDPWHYFRNITLALLEICSAQYMLPVRGWLKTIIRRCYHAVLSSNGNGDMASEKFRAILLCMQNQHDFSNDPTFMHIKGCEHGPPSVNYIFIPRDGKIVKRLEQKVFTEKNIMDIKSVSSRLNTSPCESINALAWRYAPKELYFSRAGHEMRTKLSMLHWNFLKHTAADGTRPVVGQKSYVNPTHGNVVWRKVRKSASHSWRDNIKQFTLEVRAAMTETPFATEKKRRAALARRKREIERLTRPLFPSPYDANLEDEGATSEEEDEMDSRLLSSSDPLQEQLSYIDDANLEQSDIEDDDEEEDEE